MISAISLILIISAISVISFFILRTKIFSQLEATKKAIGVINENESRFKLFMDNLPGLAYIKDNNARVLFTNKGFKTFLNIDNESINNKSAAEIFPEEFAEKIESDDRRVLESGNNETVEEYFGGRTWATYKFVIPGNNEKLLGGITLDISERKKAEDNYHKLSRVVEQSPVSIVITDTKGNIEYVNPKFTQLTGYTPEEVMGKNPRILKTDYHTEDIYKDMWETISVGSEWRGEFCNKKKNGELYWESASLSPIFDKQGNITHYLAVKEDITEKKYTEELLRHERTRMRTLIDNIPDLIYSKDINARKTLANKADLSLMGVKTEAEALGKDDYAFYPREMAEKFIAEDMQVIQSGKPSINNEGWHYDAEGKWHWYVTNKYPLRDKEGNIIGLVGIGKDITDRKLKEMELEKLLQRQRSLITLLQYSSNSVSQFLDSALDEALKVTESKFGYIYHYNESIKEFKLNTWSKDVMQECKVQNPETKYQLEKTGIWGEVVRQRKEIIVNDFMKDNPLKKGIPDGHVQMKNFLTIPILKGNEIVAVVGVANKEFDYNDSDVDHLKLLMSAVWEKVISIKAQADLKDNEIRLREAQEIAHVGYWEIDLSTKNVIGSDEAAKIYGFDNSNEGLTLDKIQSVVIGTYRQHLDNALNLLITTNKDYDELFRIKRANDDEERWIHSKAELVTDNSGKPLRITGMIQDITDIKIAEEAVRKSEEQLKLAIEGSGVGLWDWRIQAGKLNVNDRWAQICGYSLEELEPVSIDTWDKLVNPEDNIVFEDILRKHFNRETEIYECELRMKHKSGHWVWVLDRGKVVEWDKDGKPVRMSGTHLDITQRKEVEAQLQKYATELEELNQTKDKFFSIIAHDLRNPFGLIINYAELIQEKVGTASDDELKQDLDHMYSSAKRVFGLLENLLAWAKIQNSRYTVDPGEFDLTQLVESQVELYVDILKEKKISLAYEVEGSVKLIADKNQIETVVRNLISNAVKFTEVNGTIKVRVFRANSGDALPVKIIISDTGIGMEQEEIERIFEVGSTYSKKGTAGEKGTGLGLSLCREFVKNNNGTIEVESTPGKGTTFTVSLP